MASKVKPGAKHPTKPGMVMGTNNRYVSKSTYIKQKAAGAKPSSTPPSKPATKVTAAKTTPTKPSTSSTPKVGATKRLQGRIVRWNGKRWTAAGTGPKKPAPTPRKADATPKPPQGNFKAPKIPKTTPTAKPTSTPVQRLSNTAKNVAKKVVKNAPKIARAGVTNAAQLLTGDGSGQLALHAVTASNLIDAARGSTAAERNANKPKTEPKPSRVTSRQETNRRGRRITRSSSATSKPSSSKPTQSGSSESAASLARKQGLANNQRAAGMLADLRGSGSKKATAKPSGGSTAKSKPKTGANDPRNASYISSAKKLNSSKTTTKKDRDALRDKGLSTWAKANPKLAKALEKKKAKKAARRAGGTLYSGTTGMSSIG